MPLLDGGEARVTIPSGFDISKALRLRGQGLPITDVNISRTPVDPPTRGDLLVYLRIKVPKVLTATERELLVALRRVRASAESITAHGDSRAKLDTGSSASLEPDPSNINHSEDTLRTCPVCALRDEFHDGSSRTRRIYQQLTGRIKKRGRANL